MQLAPAPVVLTFVPHVRAVEPPPTGFSDAMLRMFRATATDLEKGEASLDKVVAAASAGKSLSNTELLALQVQVNRYALELDLLSKIVQQATQGLKDLLRTQV